MSGGLYFTIPANYSDIAALGGIKRDNLSLPSHLRISAEIDSLSGFDHRNQHCPGPPPQRVCWQGSRYDDRLLSAPGPQCSLAGRRAGTEQSTGDSVYVYRWPDPPHHAGSPLSERGALFTKSLPLHPPRLKLKIVCKTLKNMTFLMNFKYSQARLKLLWETRRIIKGSFIKQCHIFVFLVEILFVTLGLGLGQEEATEWLGTGNDDLNYLITHRVRICLPLPR